MLACLRLVWIPLDGTCSSSDHCSAVGVVSMDQRYRGRYNPIVQYPRATVPRVLFMGHVGHGYIRELGIGIIPYSPLGRGFFAGSAAIKSIPSESLLSKHPRYTGENLEKNKVLYTQLETLSTKYSCTPAQLALAWVLHQGNDVPIPGTTKVKNLDDNIGAVKVKLSKEDLEEISAAIPPGEVAGSRVIGILEPYSWRVANTPTSKVDMSHFQLQKQD